MSIVIEKSEEFIFEFGEFLFAGESLVIFNIVVEEMDGFRLEEGSNFGVLMDDITKVDFIDFRVNCFVSNSGPEEHHWEDGQSLEAESQIPELEEEK